MAVRLGLVMSLVIAAFGALGWSAASAQYAAPVGLCVVTPSSSAVNAGSSLGFTISATTTDGSGAPSVAGTIAVVGGTADKSSYTTDSTGKATFNVTSGSSAGMLTVNVTAGTLNCSSVVSVVAQKTNPDVIKPPDTGTGQQGDGGFGTLWAAAAGLAALGLAGGATLAVSRRRS